MLALADAAGADRFHLVGHDWGGLVAWHLAAHHPHRLRSLTVLSTPHPRALVESMTRSWQPLRSAYAVAWQVPVVPETVMLAADGRLLRAGLKAAGLDASTAEQYVNHMRQPGALRSASTGIARRAARPVPCSRCLRRRPDDVRVEHERPGAWAHSGGTDRRPRRRPLPVRGTRGGESLDSRDRTNAGGHAHPPTCSRPTMRPARDARTTLICGRRVPGP